MFFGRSTLFVETKNLIGGILLKSFILIFACLISFNGCGIFSSDIAQENYIPHIDYRDEPTDEDIHETNLLWREFDAMLGDFSSTSLCLSKWYIDEFGGYYLETKCYKRISSGVFNDDAWWKFRRFMDGDKMRLEIVDSYVR